MIKSISHYRSNKNIKFSCQYHIIWCTKFRRDLLKNEVEVDLKDIIKELCIEKSVDLIEMEVMPDHIHLLVDIDPQYGPHLFIKNAKGRSSRFLREKHKSCRSRVPTLWTNSYFISTVGGVSLDVVKQYIEEQKNA